MTEAQQRAYDQAQVMLAFSQGKKVEFKDTRETYDGVWRPIDDPAWDFYHVQYRIAPEPQEVWLWVKEGQDIVMDKYHSPEANWEGMGFTKKLFREVLP